jgi:hypothetical protein
MSPNENELKLVGVLLGSVIQEDFLALSELFLPVADPGRSLIRLLLLVRAISGVRGVRIPSDSSSPRTKGEVGREDSPRWR